LAGQPEVQDWINHVQAGLRSLAATVNNVLQFHSQPAAQLLPWISRPCWGYLGFLRPLARQKKMHIQWRAPGQAFPSSPTRAASAGVLQSGTQCFPGHEAGGRSPSPSRGARKLQAHGCRAFADQGSGIRAENLAKIFDPGFTTQSSSPGLGLAVTRKVIEQHGGTVQVESREGQEQRSR